MLEASPFWQNAFLGFVFVLVGWSVWSGWRAGVVRALAGLLGLFAGGFVGLAIGGALAPLLSRIVPLPAIFLAAVIGLVIGLGLYLAVRVLAALLFKRTAQQPSALLRLFFGAGGALVGAFVGLTLIWAALLGVRGLGSMYEGMLAVREAAVDPAARMVVKLKRSIEAGPTGRSLVALDVIPDGYYRVIKKSIEVAGTPRSWRRLLEYPAIAEFLRDPRMAAIVRDPAAADAIREGNAAGLFSNPKLVAALNDPALIAKVQTIDIEAALDHALAAPPVPAAARQP